MTILPEERYFEDVDLTHNGVDGSYRSFVTYDFTRGYEGTFDYEKVYDDIDLLSVEVEVETDVWEHLELTTEIIKLFTDLIEDLHSQLENDIEGAYYE